jgi:hypothetical protein
VAVRQVRASVVEKVRAAWVRQAPSGSFDCAPPGAASRDKSVRRSAQDDVFVVRMAVRAKSPDLPKPATFPQSPDNKGPAIWAAPLMDKTTDVPSRGGHHGLHDPSDLRDRPSPGHSDRSEDGSNTRRHTEVSAILQEPTHIVPRTSSNTRRPSRNPGPGEEAGPRNAEAAEQRRYRHQLRQKPAP